LIGPVLFPALVTEGMVRTPRLCAKTVRFDDNGSTTLQAMSSRTAWMSAAGRKLESLGRPKAVWTMAHWIRLLMTLLIKDGLRERFSAQLAHFPARKPQDTHGFLTERQSVSQCFNRVPVRLLSNGRAQPFQGWLLPLLTN
jgi:hypothetical protein